ncbi:cation transporter, partial [Candidatus Sumerlaeota bacterium]|nr:cation transporter [Candidatus Sumerlaeota bacterium]
MSPAWARTHGQLEFMVNRLHTDCMEHAHPNHSQIHSHGHNHGNGGSSSTGTLIGWAFWINFAFMLIEAVGGWMTGSLALLADAGHMFNDVLSLALTWATYRLAARAANGVYTYGYRRAQVLA